MPADLADARAHHRRGDLEAAERLYRHAMATEPDRAEALHGLGLVLLQRGDLAGATESLGRAVSLQPEAPDCHADLAEALRQLGQAGAALDHLRTAVGLAPDRPDLRVNLGALLVDLGALDAAIAAFQAALALRPDLVAAHNNLANALRLRGDLAGALVHFEAAVALDPGSFEAHANLGTLHLRRGDAEAALPHWVQAVHLRPDALAARLQLGNTLLSRGDLDAAEVHLRAAVALRPDQATAHASLAALLEQRGDPDAALESLREALRREPRHPGALARLATRLRARLGAAERATIEALIADPALPSEARTPLLFGLAQVHDALGEFPRAARLAAEANTRQAAEIAARGQRYDPDAYRGFVDQIVATFGPAFFERVRGWGLDSERPVFVVGLPRSGTTLVEQILASHPRGFGAGELRLARQTFAAIPGPPGTIAECLDRLTRDDVRQLAGRHLEALTRLAPGADRIVDKMPENYVFLGFLAALFPRARFVVCRRDVRDVALSCWFTHFGQVRWASDPAHIVARVTAFSRLMDHWRRTLPVPLHEVDYEALVADPEPHARALIAAGGLDWDPACLDFHRGARPVQTVSVAQVRRPIYRTSVGRWAPYRTLIPDLFAGLPPGA